MNGANNDTPDNNNPNSQSRFGLFGTILHYFMLYIVVTTLTQKLFPTVPKVITSQEAQRINSASEGEKLQLTSQERISNIKNKGRRAPIFATHDHEGKMLGPHVCAFKKGSKLSLEIYGSNKPDFNWLIDVKVRRY